MFQVSRSQKLASIASSDGARWFLSRVDRYVRYWNDPQRRNQWVYSDPCVYCYGPAGTVDHIEPRATGGSDRWQNRVASCPKCNSSKGKWTLLRYLASGKAKAVPRV